LELLKSLAQYVLMLHVTVAHVHETPWLFRKDMLLPLVSDAKRKAEERVATAMAKKPTV
jgi:hypothetical protein